MLTNSKLIESFLEASLRQKEVFLSNATFRAESVCGVNQLMSHKGGVLIKMSLQQSATQLWLRRNSAHIQLLRGLLHRYNFLVTEGKQDRYFDCYRYVSVKPGQEFNYDTGRQLWKYWRSLKRHSLATDSTPKLLVCRGQKWFSIRAISISNELLFIETTEGTDLIYNLATPIIWLTSHRSHSPADLNLSDAQYIPATKGEKVSSCC